VILTFIDYNKMGKKGCIGKYLAIMNVRGMKKKELTTI